MEQKRRIGMNKIGIKDKNGKEIREGDVYHQGAKNILYVVVERDSKYIGKQLGSSSYAGIEHFQKDIEVIGNVNENPNLITA
ncbi:YopX family protein [Lysinibacillus sp. KU-BSD001]|uniref:YopX family protein n=1 Tax=Lysinibacillus sp. KU-BSD001 TaxID=3141328 RepID=UPI0036ED3509